MGGETTLHSPLGDIFSHSFYSGLHLSYVTAVLLLCWPCPGLHMAGKGAAMSSGVAEALGDGAGEQPRFKPSEYVTRILA